jgi:hypothetical protein
LRPHGGARHAPSNLAIGHLTGDVSIDAARKPDTEAGCAPDRRFQWGRATPRLAWVWESEIFTSTLAVLLVSILLAFHRSGASRALRISFALFGWGYLLLTMVQPTDLQDDDLTSPVPGFLAMVTDRSA